MEIVLPFPCSRVADNFNPACRAQTGAANRAEAGVAGTNERAIGGGAAGDGGGARRRERAKKLTKSATNLWRDSGVFVFTKSQHRF